MLLNPKYKVCIKSDILITNGTSSWFMRDFHYHDYFEIYFTQQEGVRFFVNDTVYTLSKGDIVVFNDKDLHRSVAPNSRNYTRILVEFNPRYVSHMSTEDTNLLECFAHRKPSFSHRIHTTDVEAKEFLRIFTAIEQAHNDLKQGNKYGAGVVQRIRLAELLIFVNSLYRSHDMTYETREACVNYKKLKPILDYIHENYADDITIDSLSSMFYISKPYIYMLFKKVTGYSPNDYLKSWRIIKACTLLENKDLNISQISELVGFNDCSHFIRTFRQLMDTTPGRYARIHRQV